MSKKKSTETEATSNALKKAEETKSELVNFVANNILNNITLNQVVTLVQQVAMRDANQVVNEADDAKLKEIGDALEAAKQASESPAESAKEDDADS
jgi:alpha-N-acetylglucosamine transferase